MRGCNGTQSSFISSICFPAGGLLPGASHFAFNFFFGSPRMVMIGPDFPLLENPSKVLGSNDWDFVHFVHHGKCCWI